LYNIAYVRLARETLNVDPELDEGENKEAA
jgi:hypothetical protein